MHWLEMCKLQLKGLICSFVPTVSQYCLIFKNMDYEFILLYMWKSRTE
uniref:Uncharacterized protein n=1 Tax=Anguilla anguilla TaxID=7936 RepID=A0A0E9WVK9_ANGAN